MAIELCRLIEKVSHKDITLLAGEKGMGTVMSLQDDMLGHFIIPIAAMRRDGTSRTYVEESYPAAADIELVNIMNSTVTDFGKRYLNGINCTMDGFYSQMHVFSICVPGHLHKKT